MATDDLELARQYAAHQSESAFAALVSRHASLVYSVALRQARDPQLAEEITQTVFIILARKAGSLNEKTIITGWLYRTACYVSNAARKKEHLRRAHEQEACMQSTLQNDSPDTAWEQMSSLLEDAMLRLGQSDRDALLLRFFEGRSLNEVGTALGSSEEAAKKRVSRALEKLHLYFQKRGVSSTTAIIAGAISANSVQAAPVALAKSVTAVAITKGATASGSTLALIEEALKLMAWTKLKTTIVAGAAVLLAVGGTTTLTVKAISHYREKAREDAVWRHITAPDTEQLETAPPIVSIRPAKLGLGFGTAWISRALTSSDGIKQMGFNKSVGRLLQNAYQIREPRIVYSGKLPEGTYDYIVSLPDHQLEALQAAMKEKFGLVGRKEMRDTDVLILKAAKQNAPDLKPAPDPLSVNLNNTSAGRFEIRNEPISNLAFSLEQYLKTPVIDQTGLTGRYDADLTWDANDQDFNPNGLKQAAVDQLGLELMPDHQTIEMLVVEKVK